MRYFFDRDICLWIGNRKARAELGYNIDLADLPLSLETLYRDRQLIYIWLYIIHGGSGQRNWTPVQRQQENKRFEAAALTCLEDLINELGQGFTILNELRLYYYED